MCNAELWTVIPEQMRKYQLPHRRLDQINDHKHDIIESYPLSYLAQAANKKFVFMSSYF